LFYCRNDAALAFTGALDSSLNRSDVMKRIFVVALAVAAVAQPALAQNLCPNDTSPAVIRLSKLKPGGTMDGVRKAVADHAAWYKSHGYAADRIFLAPAIVPVADKPGSFELAPDQYYTVHLKAVNVTKDKQDAAWAAYVAEYNQNSEIVHTDVLCVNPDK
jgi:hypothetical protein